MHAVLVNEDQSLAWSEVPDPIPGADEVIIDIQATASGLGMAAIQLVRALGGTVMTTVGTPAKGEFVRSLGADIVVVRGTDDLGAALDEHPVDTALDCVGGPDLERLFWPAFAPARSGRLSTPHCRSRRPRQPTPSCRTARTWGR